MLARNVARLNCLVKVVVDIDYNGTGWAVDPGAADFHLTDRYLEAVAGMEVV
jgi:hypothetical protein